MTILISACLLGVNCRYSGKASEISPGIRELMKKHVLVPACPEQLGGLATPRRPAEILGDRVINQNGCDVTREFSRGGEETVRLARLFNCKYAVLKERSPSCGKGEIYDGSFSKTLKPGNGVTADLLLKEGLTVFGESELDKLL